MKVLKYVLIVLLLYCKNCKLIICGWVGGSFFENPSNIVCILDFTLALKISFLAKFLYQFLTFLSISQYMQIIGGEVSSTIFIQNLKNVYNIIFQRLRINFLQHIQQKLLKIYCTILIFIHIPQHDVNLLLVDIVSQTPQEEFKCSA